MPECKISRICQLPDHIRNPMPFIEDVWLEADLIELLLEARALHRAARKAEGYLWLSYHPAEAKYVPAVEVTPILCQLVRLLSIPREKKIILWELIREAVRRANNGLNGSF